MIEFERILALIVTITGLVLAYHQISKTSLERQKLKLEILKLKIEIKKLRKGG